MSEEMTRRLWLGMLDSDRLYRYYGYMAERMGRIHVWLSMGVAACSLGAAASLLAQAPVLISSLLCFGVAVAVIWMLLYDYSRKATLASEAAARYGRFSLEWTTLWYDASRDPDRQDLCQRLRTLESEVQGDSAKLVGLGLRDDRLNEKCAGETYEVKQAEFAA